MGAIETKAFKSGNSVAVRLPAEFGIAAGAKLSIERVGAELRIVVRDEEAEQLVKFRQMIKELNAMNPLPADARLTREDVRIEFPDRPGLY